VQLDAYKENEQKTMTEQEETKQPVSTAQVRYSDARTTRYRQYLNLVKIYADDIGEPNAGQKTLLAMLEVPLRALQDIRDKLDTHESTLKDGRANEAIVKDFSKIADLSMRLIREFYHLSGKSATKKRLKPISEIIEGDK
jgi:hypothetical protein